MSEKKLREWWATPPEAPWLSDRMWLHREHAERYAKDKGTEVIKVREVPEEKPKPVEAWAVVRADGSGYTIYTSRTVAERKCKDWNALPAHYPDGPYRIAHLTETPQWPAFAPEWAEYYARDEDGGQWLYSVKPEINTRGGHWESMRGIEGQFIGPDLAPGKPWYESLVKRP